jgi:hypothetical protein
MGLDRAFPRAATETRKAGADEPKGSAMKFTALLCLIKGSKQRAGAELEQTSLQLLSMAQALSRLIPNVDGLLILVIRHRQEELSN